MLRCRAAVSPRKWKGPAPQWQLYKGHRLGRLHPSRILVRCCAEASGAGDETITAIVTATAQDSGSVAIVRLSGQDALRSISCDNVNRFHWHVNIIYIKKRVFSLSLYIYGICDFKLFSSPSPASPIRERKRRKTMARFCK